MQRSMHQRRPGHFALRYRIGKCPKPIHQDLMWISYKGVSLTCVGTQQAHSPHHTVYDLTFGAISPLSV